MNTEKEQIEKPAHRGMSPEMIKSYASMPLGYRQAIKKIFNDKFSYGSDTSIKRYLNANPEKRMIPAPDRWIFLNAVISHYEKFLIGEVSVEFDETIHLNQN